MTERERRLADGEARAHFEGEQAEAAGKSIASGLLIVPGWVDLAGPGLLVWNGNMPKLWTTTEPDDTLLERFLALDDCEDDWEFVRFARRWGCLSVSADHIPRMLAGAEEFEPIAAWREYARKLKAMRRVAYHLHEGNLAPTADVDEMGIEPPPELEALRKLKTLGSHPLSPLDMQRQLLSLAVNVLLSRGEVQLAFEWEDQPRAKLSFRDLRGALAVRIMSAVTQTGGIALCSNCGDIYTRKKRRPKKGYPNYCPEKECQRAMSARTSSNYREKGSKTHG